MTCLKLYRSNNFFIFNFFGGKKPLTIRYKKVHTSPEKTQALIEEYLYAEWAPLKDEILDLLEGEKPSVLERKSIGDRILHKILGFVETFINGMNV